jgi:hypothetical protein
MSICANCGTADAARYIAGLCSPCYHRRWQAAHPGARFTPRAGTCPACMEWRTGQWTSGLCKRCYKRAWRAKQHKAPRKPRPSVPPDVRFWRLVDTSDGPDACWLWLGAILPNGYGTGLYLTRTPLVRIYPHRFAYLWAYGYLPEGAHIDHLCHDPPVCWLGRVCPPALLLTRDICAPSRGVRTVTAPIAGSRGRRRRHEREQAAAAPAAAGLGPGTLTRMRLPGDRPDCRAGNRGHCARQAASWIVEYFDGSVHQPASPHAGSTNVGPQLPV